MGVGMQFELQLVLLLLMFWSSMLRLDFCLYLKLVRSTCTPEIRVASYARKAAKDVTALYDRIALARKLDKSNILSDAATLIASVCN